MFQTDHMHFEYEITADEYAASQLLCHQLNGGRKRVERAVGWIVAGVGFIVMAWINRSIDFVPISFAGIGAWLIYAAFANLFPERHFRRSFKKSELAGKRFRADINEDGFEIAGDLHNWRVRWPGARLKGENERVFILYSAGTLFMFGKKYLTVEQQGEFRRLSGLGNSKL
jgi:hypothetical protein